MALSTRSQAPAPIWLVTGLRPLALAALLACALPAQAVITASGNIGVGPVFSALGPGDTSLPTSTANIGTLGLGGLTVDAGSFLQLARLNFGTGGTGVGDGLVSGAGTRVELLGNGTGDQVQRLSVGAWGSGKLTVKAGAVIDTRGNQTPCLLSFHYCDSFVGSAAGDNGLLNIDGAGTQVRIGQNLFIAQPGLAIQGLDGYTYGVPGGTTRGTVNVTNGGLLSTDRAQIGPRHWSTNATRFERNIAEVNISGAGSRWVVTGGQTVLNHATGAVGEGGAGVLTANDRNALAFINISDGGRLEIQGVDSVNNYLILSNGGGRTDMRVTGVGSAVAFTGDGASMQVGRRLGSARLDLLAGAAITGVWYGVVGRDGSFGEMVVDGAGTVFSLSGTASASLPASGRPENAVLDLGRNGTGVLSVSNGGRVEVVATESRNNGPHLNLGREAASAGTLNISGANSVVSLSAQSVLPGGGAAEAFNPFVRVGRDGNGSLNITGGGKLLIDGNAVSTVVDSRSTNLFIGGTGDTTNGGKGIALVSGAGSEIRLTGSDTYIGVGHGPQSFGQLTVNNQASISAIGINVGRSGGVGVLAVDNATLNFSGQQTGNIQAGAFMSIGRSGGIGVANIGGGSVVTLHNMGSSGASLNLGGTGTGPTGDGSLTLSGASRIKIEAAAGLASATIGRDGSALMRIRGASSLDVGDGNLAIARLPGSDGTLLVSDSSTVTAGWVGVGRNKTATGDVDGGTGTLVLINSTLTAANIVIGSNGFLGGTGTITGNVVNHGIFAPGNSPGTMEIGGSFTAAAGSRMILEVASNGAGGFNTDHVIFTSGRALDLSGLNVEFRFLGTANPNAFAPMFTLDTFFQSRQADGSMAALAPALFQTASFSAQSDGYQISNFSFSPSTGATFTATPVPEPAGWALMLAGLLGMGTLARRRQGKCASANAA